ncbi:amidase family protein [Streptomyces werraensis]|uniref:amidase family protein n=1 Tax=Streptomyces werraensis TaxID=68284 RepID=UPI00380E298F
MSQRVAENPGQPVEGATIGPGTHPDGVELGRLLAAGQLKVCSLTTSAIEQASTDNSFITVTESRALREAEAAHERLTSDVRLSPLDGVPVAVKDLFDVEGTVTTAGSPVLADLPAKQQDAGVVQLLSQAGTVLIGKTNLSECAFSGLGINPYYGTPLKPDARGRHLIPGGSSSGSAVAVASGIVPIALGTDTSGSVRVPAAFCGIVGYKASAQRYSKDGMTPLSHTLDSVGILARSMRDILTMDRLLGGSAPAPASRVDGPSTVTGARLVVPHGEMLDDCDPEVRARFEAALELLTGHGVRIERRGTAALEDAQRIMDENTTLVGAEAYYAYKYLLDPPHRDRIDPGLVRRLTHAAQHHHQVEPVYRAMDPLRRQLRQELGDGLLICPTVRHTAPELQPLLDDDELYDRTNQRSLRTTMLSSYLGMPGVSLPIGRSDEDGVGLLVSAPAGEDARLLSIADGLHPLLQETAALPAQK